MGFESGLLGETFATLLTSERGQHDDAMTYGLRPVNERRRYFVKTSLIGWVQAFFCITDPSGGMLQSPHYLLIEISLLFLTGTVSTKLY